MPTPANDRVDQEIALRARLRLGLAGEFDIGPAGSATLRRDLARASSTNEPTSRPATSEVTVCSRCAALVLDLIAARPRADVGDLAQPHQPPPRRAQRQLPDLFHIGPRRRIEDRDHRKTRLP